MMRFHQPKVYGNLYIILIVVCALIYWNIQGFKGTQVLNILDAFYFSIITITTLGYGDIVPIFPLTRVIAALQALLGVGLIGLFLASLGSEAKFKRNQNLRQNLLDHYKRIKREIALNIIWVSQSGGREDISADSKTIDLILTVEGFKSLFQGGKLGNEGFYAFRNGLNNSEYQHQQLLYLLSSLANMIDFTVQSGAIEGNESLLKLKSLSNELLILEKKGIGYDEESSLSGYIYETFSGWNSVKGYLGYDPVEQMISEAK